MTEETKEEAPVAPPLPSEYYAMVVDSGPIIKQDVRNLMGKAQSYVTTPSVLREIRDSKARDHLEHSVLPLLDLKTREPSDKAMQDVIAFAKQTGDYASLSTVDLQVLALTLDLEREGSLVSGNIDLSHIRTTPKRKIGLGNITPMNTNAQTDKPSNEPQTPAPILEEEKTAEQNDGKAEEKTEPPPVEAKSFSLNLDDYDEVEESDDDEEDEGQAGVELTATLSAMRSKMASNAANIRKSLLKLNPKNNASEDGEAPKIPVTFSQVKQRVSENTAKLAENTAKMRETMSPRNLAENTAKMKESISSKVTLTKESLPTNLNEMKQRMTESTTQMKQRMAENTANVKNTLASTVSATKESLLTIANKKSEDGGNNPVNEEVEPAVESTEDAKESPVEEQAASEPVVEAPTPTVAEPPVKKSWATLVNPTAASVTSVQDSTPVVPFSKMALESTSESGGQFDDASEDEDEEEPQNAATVEEELQEEFPSLLAASTVPYEGEDDEIDANNAEPEREEVDQNPHHRTRASVFMTEEEKQLNLKPLSKSGRTYNSFRKYKGLMKPKQPKKKSESLEEDEEVPQLVVDENATSTESKEPQGSRFLGGGGGGETMLEEDDDGIGWITSSEDIKVMKNEAGGVLDPGKTGTIGGKNGENNQAKKASGPHLSQRAACATTDFAMQNVLLQMNLILLSTEGMRIRRLKTWVMRCGACFKIHLPDEDFKDETNHHMRRLFCKHCGSDMMQRISASVDGKTGRLKLHFSKRKQGRHHSIRGTKFALPKPGTNNKYKGDLLLREDQLLSGAWNQKVKINSGRKYQTAKSQSMFGRDIASSVGCNVRSTSSASFGGKGWASSSNTSTSGSWSNSDDIRVGFGARKNPNAAKGRERRGKKKKSSDRACGMRRY